MIMIVNENIESLASLKKVIDDMHNAGKKKLVIINGSTGEQFSKPLLVSFLNTLRAAQENPEAMRILAVKAPALLSEELSDLGIYCGASFADKAIGKHVADVGFSWLGRADKVVVTEDEIIITGGGGNPLMIQDRIDVMTKQMEAEKDGMFKEKMKRRIASMNSGVGIIRVGASTEQERTYLKDKIEDAVNATKTAMEEGVVAGGGLCLKEISDELGEKHILYKALRAPYELIRTNMGKEIDVPANILDSAKVVRMAVTNAFSTAAKFITAEIGITDRVKSLWDELENKLYPQNETTSFRDDENMDRGIGISR